MKCYKCGTSIADDSRYCPACGNSVQVEYVETAEAKKPQKHKMIVFVIISVSIVILFALVMFLGQRNKFTMEADGTLYCEHPSGIIEIPRKYDGKARGFSGDYSSWDYKYDGTLRQFLKYHSWVLYENYDSDTTYKTIHCKDYILRFATKGYDLGSTYDADRKHTWVTLYYEVFNQHFGSIGGIIESFETLSDLEAWLN